MNLVTIAFMTNYTLDLPSIDKQKKTIESFYNVFKINRYGYLRCVDEHEFIPNKYQHIKPGLSIEEQSYQEKQNKTIVIISQRVSSAKNADTILFFENGKLMEQGNHEELLKLNAKYADLYNNQLNYERSNTD